MMARPIQRLRSLPALAHDNKGAALIEFAILAPAILTLFFGVFQMAIYLQAYNAVRSVTSDGARYVMIEYQKNNTLTDDQIESVVLGIAVNAPYLLKTDRLTINVDRTGVSRISGATEIDISVTYSPGDILPGVSLDATQIDYSRPVFVVG